MQAYNSRGVSATKEEVHSAIKSHDKGIYPGAFCKIINDFNGDNKYCAIMHTDDVGTKAITAYLMYKENNNANIWAGMAIDSAVMNLDDLLCVGAYDKFIFSNTIGRNAQRIGGDAIKAIIDGYVDFCNKMKEYNINIEMCGGETSDTGDIVATIFIDSTFYARLERQKVIDCANIKAGDVIVGLASFGQCIYEDKYNSGIGSNGLTAARHVLLNKIYAKKYPESYSGATDKSLIYSGKYKLEDKLIGSNISVGEALLSPTRTYAPVVKEVLEKYFSGVHGIVHCTGGGQTKCKNFGNNLRYIKDNLFKEKNNENGNKETPAFFSALKQSGEISAKEMYQVFNMGHRLEFFCDKSIAEDIIDISNKYKIGAQIVGRVEDNNENGNKVIIEDCGERWEF